MGFFFFLYARVEGNVCPGGGYSILPSAGRIGVGYDRIVYNMHVSVDCVWILRPLELEQSSLPLFFFLGPAKNVFLFYLIKEGKSNRGNKYEQKKTNHSHTLKSLGTNCYMIICLYSLLLPSFPFSGDDTDSSENGVWHDEWIDSSVWCAFFLISFLKWNANFSLEKAKKRIYAFCFVPFIWHKDGWGFLLGSNKINNSEARDWMVKGKGLITLI